MYFVVNEQTECTEKFECYYEAYDRETILKMDGVECTTYSSAPITYKQNENFYSHDKKKIY